MPVELIKGDFMKDYILSIIFIIVALILILGSVPGWAKVLVSVIGVVIYFLLERRGDNS